MQQLLNQINAVVWGPITLWLIGLTGLYLMLGLRFMPLRRIGFAVRQTLGSMRHQGGEGADIAFTTGVTH
ncbi:MAG: sodium:alanine symporter family protein, partial [Vulcanococcus sp.]